MARRWTGWNTSARSSTKAARVLLLGEQRPGLRVLPFVLRPRLLDVELRNEQDHVAAAILIDVCQVIDKVLAPQTSLLEFVIEDVHAHRPKAVCDLFDVGAVLARERQRDIVLTGLPWRARCARPCTLGGLQTTTRARLTKAHGGSRCRAMTFRAPVPRVGSAGPPLVRAPGSSEAL